MRAMVLTAARQLALMERERPPARANEVLVRVTHSGLCGTDLKIYTGAIPVCCPLIMGHEAAGEVVESQFSELAPGDRVVIDPVLYCGHCFHCRKGQTNLCANGKLIGRDTDGGFADYAAIPGSQLFRLPASIDNRTAPLLQVATTCLHGQRMTSLFAGESVAVIGLGVSGQLHLQIAKARGAGTVIGVSRSAFKNEMARALGADLTIEAGETAVTGVLEATGGRGADLVIESSGVPSAVRDAIRMVRFGGQILLFGIISAREAALPFYDLYFKELTVRNGRAAKPEDFTDTISLVERGAIRLEPLITHRMALDQLEAAIGLVDDGPAERLKIILDHT
ncbi:MAG: alcohol dehydrogenase catalytic domain-containing protein [Acidobacteriia bacterium]|nr:alcohol dehydrogenase catalytic domain-containing protein [Terriglobia bacterium]MBV8902490.1 alcohol dehydrogenase catalytic domain-containing protein [Terriglobia bacterium]